MHFIGDGDTDLFNGTEDRDYMNGMGGNDRLFGYGGDDRLFGGDGNDRLSGGAGIDYMDGGRGDDRLYFFQLGLLHGVTVDFLNGLVTDDGFGTQDRIKSIQNFSGSEFADTVYGSNARNQLFGAHGGDQLYGAGDTDRLAGGDGDDTLDGGMRRDRLIGENGNDVFVLTPLDLRVGDIHKVSEIIYDFTNTGGERDRIDLRQIDAVAGGADDAFSWIGAGPFTNVAGQLRFETISNHVFVFGDTNGDGAADFSIKLGRDGLFNPLSASDFFL